MNTTYEHLSLAVQKGDRNQVKTLVQEGLSAGVTAQDLITHGLIPGMNATGERWSKGEYFIPQVLVAARAMNMGLELLEPLLAGSRKSAGTVVIGTVEGDLHDIGKNLVGMMLKGKGFTVIDLKTDVGADLFVEAIKEHQPQVVAMSALLTTTMLNMKRVVEAIEASGLRGQVKIACGGAAVSDGFYKEIGADMYEADAVAFANRLIADYEQ
jgi:5-methyltetrahydrofolate--homocysteine methyltransferase